MLNEIEIIEIGHRLLDKFYQSSAVNDTIWFDKWTTLYEEIMFVLDEYAEKTKKERK